MALTLRNTKGSPLSYDEMDGNFQLLYSASWSGSSNLNLPIIADIVGTASLASNIASQTMFIDSDDVVRISGSAVVLGSLTVSGSNTLKNFGPTELSGSLKQGLVYTLETPGAFSHAEGISTTAKGNHSHAEGSNTKALGNHSHTEGNTTTTLNSGSHAEGYNTTTVGKENHAEGYQTIAIGNWSHAEGERNSSSGSYSHAEGYNTTTIGTHSHAEGESTTAKGNYSHTSGLGTISNGSHQTIFGTYNFERTDSGAFIVGSGRTSSGRANALEIYDDGTTIVLTMPSLPPDTIVHLLPSRALYYDTNGFVKIKP